MTTKTRKAPIARPKHKMSIADAKKKADEMVAEEMRMEKRFDNRKPTGPRDPNFDHAAAVERLSVWSVQVISILEELYDSFQDLTHELDQSPDLYDLFRSPSSVFHACLDLSYLVCRSYDCIPKLLALPRPV